MKRLAYPDLDETLYFGTLENGLTVAVLPRKGFSKKLAYFVTDFGSMHTEFDFEGAHHTVPAGIAHYLEHKIFDMPNDRDVSAEFAAMGAITNAFTSYDLTAYYFSCTENFRECLRLLLEFVSTPYFTPESVEKERGIIDQEIDMSLDTPDNCIFETLMQNTFSEHPVRVPILGTHETIRCITPELLSLCHRAFYTSGNMMLCVVGDVEVDEVTRIAEEVLGTERHPVAQKRAAWEESPRVCTPYSRETMEVAMPTFSIAFKCDSVPNGDEGIRQEIIADLAAEALFGESSSLYLQMYESGLIDSAFGGGFEAIDGCSMLICSGDSDAPEQVRDAIVDAAARISAEGISDEMFQRMKRSALGRRIRDLDSFDSTCFRICAYHYSGFDYFRFPELYQMVTPQALCDFLAHYVTQERCAMAVIEPNEEVSA